MRNAVVTFHQQHGPQSGSRVQIHDAPPITPGSVHNRVEESPEATTYARNDSMKTRVTISHGPQTSVGPAHMSVSEAYAPQLAAASAPLTIEQHIEQLKARAVEQRQALEAGERALEETLQALDQAQDQYARGLDHEAAERKRLAADRRELIDARAEAMREISAERAQLEAARAELEADKAAHAAQLEADKAEKHPTDPAPASKAAPSEGAES